MKKLFKLCFIPLIVLVLGLGFAMSGNDKLDFIGMLLLTVGMPVTMFLLVVISLVMIIKGRLHGNHENAFDETGAPQIGGRESEPTQTEDINPSYRDQSQYNQAQFIINQTAEIYKYSTLKEKVLGWLFFGFLMTDFALILVFSFLKIWVGAIVCFCIFGGTILISAIVKKILEKSSMHVSKNKLALLPKYEGTVTACLFSSSSSSGGDEYGYSANFSRVTYRVIIMSEGKTYNAYSDKYYKTGEAVTFLAKGKRATILDGEEYDK